MPSRSLITLEMVATDTPAASATSVIVSLRAIESHHSLDNVIDND